MRSVNSLIIIFWVSIYFLSKAAVAKLYFRDKEYAQKLIFYWILIVGIEVISFILSLLIYYFR